MGDDGGTLSVMTKDTLGDSGFAQPGAAGGLEARAYMEIAESAASYAVRDTTKLMGCDLGKDEGACVKDFLPKFTKRVYRRPPTNEELDAVGAHHKRLRALPGSDAAGAVRGVIAALLQSPGFVYRWELGPRPAMKPVGGLIKLNAYELASRLSYFVTQSAPDSDLLALADAGKLGDPLVLQEQAQRLLKTPRAREMFRDFHETWLALAKIGAAEKDPTVYKGFGDEARVAMANESRLFIDHVMTEGDGKLDTLFSSSLGFVNSTLAKIYGVSGVTGAMHKPTMMNPAERFGIMTQGAFLASHAYPYESAPVKRGVAIREHLLCQAIPVPPAGLMIEPPPPNPNKSVREQFVQHSADPSCKGCHESLDPLGFAFESYDGIGKFRTTSGGKSVDPSGVLLGVGAGPVSFANTRGLMEAVRSSAEFKRCVTGTWMRFALARREGKADGGSLDAAFAAFQRSGFVIKDLVAATVQTDSFRFRTPSAGEALQ